MRSSVGWASSEVSEYGRGEEEEQVGGEQLGQVEGETAGGEELGQVEGETRVKRRVVRGSRNFVGGMSERGWVRRRVTRS